MQCGNCGVEMIAGAAFCPSCGKAISLAVAEPSPAARTAASPGLASNAAGALCYLVGFVTGILFLIIEPYRRDRFVRFHAFQSIFLSLAWFATYLVVSLFLVLVPGILWRFVWMLHSLLDLGFFLLWLFLMYKSYNHEQFKLPVIGDWAAKQAQAGEGTDSNAGQGVQQGARR
jgi:uncharacterized membrane protein